jgi:hypothetical protein
MKMLERRPNHVNGVPLKAAINKCPGRPLAERWRIRCLRCDMPFHSEGRNNRLCEACREYANKYSYLEETYAIAQKE